MKRSLWKSMGCLALLAAVFQPIFPSESVNVKAADTLSGLLTSDIRHGAGPFLITGDLCIPAGTTVSIARGTVLLFDDFAALAYFILLWCDNTKNPYLAGRDAGVRVISQSFTDGDSVTIFSPESLALVLHLKEHIDRVSLRTHANRFWSTIDTIIPAAYFDKQPLMFRFSFYDTGWQEVSIITYLITGDSLEELLKVYVWSPLHQLIVNAIPGDTMPPELVSLLGNGRPLTTGQVTADSVFQVKAALFDNSGFFTATINGMVMSAETGGIWFNAAVTLEHRTGGMPLHIFVLDSSGNSLDTMVIINLNRPPFFTQTPQTVRISVDSLFSTRIGVADPDNDSVSQTAIIRRSGGDSVLMLDTGGLLTWRPQSSDTGWNSVMVRAWDGFEAAETTFITYVAGEVMKSIPVRFIAKSTDLPRLLVATEDTLHFKLLADSVSGTPPLRYSAFVTGGPVLLEKSINAAVFWAPTAGDTGMRRIEMIVVDSLGFADTAMALIAVVPVHRVSVFFEETRSIGMESMSPQSIRVRLSEPAHRQVIATYAIDWTKTTADRAGFDLPVNLRLVFDPVDTVRDIGLVVIDNSLVEPDRQLTLTLTSLSSNALPGDRAVHMHIIVNDDFSLRVSVSPDSAGTVAQKVQGATSNGPYQAGTEIELTARPASGYRLVAWSGPVMATTDSMVVHVRMDSSLTVGTQFRMKQPVITVQPINQTVTEGQGTFFSIAATGLNLNYQWQRNGGRFRCVVRNSSGSDTSSEAFLSVLPIQ